MDVTVRDNADDRRFELVRDGEVAGLAAYRVRDDNTDRITGVQFNTKIPPLRNLNVPPPSERWGTQGPS